MLSRRRKDLNDYQPESSAGKGYVYRGQYWQPSIQGSDLLFFKALMTAVTCVNFGLLYVMGRLNLPSLRMLYVVLPFLLLLFFSGRALLAAFSLFGWKEKMTLHQHKQSWKRLGQSGLLAALTGAALLLAEIIYLFFGGGQIQQETPMVVLIITSAAVMVAVWRVMVGLPCLVEDRKYVG
jgi:hypothetical protein